MTTEDTSCVNYIRISKYSSTQRLPSAPTRHQQSDSDVRSSALRLRPIPKRAWGNARALTFRAGFGKLVLCTVFGTLRKSI